jgi:mannose-1-phosphate guanylyltransferase
VAEASVPNNAYAVIMAGGGGTRLWPLSRQDHPKQSLRLVGNRTMFQISVQRLAPLFTPERILVVTSERYASDLRQQCPELLEANFVLEPAARGTAPAIALCAAEISRRDARAMMVCLTADHFIRNEPRFRELLAAAVEVAARDYLVTLGIVPSYPATGFGYIQRGASLGRFRGFDTYRAERFKEKPSQAEAEEMLADGHYSWNSGMFVWRAARFLAELERQLPDLHRALAEIEAAPDRRETVWSGVANTTVDYGIMEGARDVAVIPAEDLGWSDIGSWEALFEVLDAGPDGNVVIGAEHQGLETSGSLIHSSRASNLRPRMIATMGLSDLVIVDTDDVLLVCRRDRSQEVKALVDRLKQDKDCQKYL